MKRVLISIFILHSSIQGLSQQLIGRDSTNRAITTSVPFILIAPDARSSAMGDAGAAISPDANAVFWNPAKLAYIESDLSLSASFTPWLKNVVNDMSISYLSVVKKITEEQAAAFTLRYFDLGDINLTNTAGQTTQQISPREFTLSGTYSRKLTESFSVGLTARYINSNLLSGASINSSTAQAANGFSVDLGVFYESDIILGAKNGNFAVAGGFSNFGPKVTYQGEEDADFIPTNLRLGTALSIDLDPFNAVTFAFDVNKLLVPSPPVFEVDENGSLTNQIARGKDPNRGLFRGVFGSFSDAPDGFSEEMQEVMISAGIEYWYNELFAVRTGYFYENKQKGGRNFFTVGIGLRYQVFGVDFAYLLPTEQNHPLAETLRVSLQFNLDTQNVEKSVTDDQ